MKLRTKQKVSGMIFAAPFLAGCMVFYFVPFVISIFYSLTIGLKQKTFVGLQNYLHLLHNQSFLLALKNTVCFMGIAIPLLMLLSLLAAVLMNSLGKAGRVLGGILLIPMIVPIASITKVWQITFADRGMVNGILSAAGIETQSFFHGNWAFIMVILIFFWKNCGYLALIYAAALSNIPMDCIEAARLEGGGRIKIFVKIVVPLLTPASFFVLLLSILNSFKIFREVFMLTGEYPDTSIYFVQHYMNNNFYNLNYQKLSTASVILSIFIFLIVAVAYSKERKSVSME